MTDLLITGIGELTTNAVGLGDDEADPTGLIRDAAVLVRGGRVAWAGRAADVPAADPAPARHRSCTETPAMDRSLGAQAVSRGELPGELPGEPRGAVHVVDTGGRAVVPGFVDSHTHLVFGGDRADEFEARMAGVPYAAGGIRRTSSQSRLLTTPASTSRLCTQAAMLSSDRANT